MDLGFSSMSPPAFLTKFQITLPSAITSMVSVDSTPLDEDYVPSDYDVVCGRGKGVYNKPGNRRFRAIVRTHVDEYVSMKSKIDKSQLLNRIIDEVRAQNNGTASFVKQGKDGTWFDIGDEQAREKVGHAIREAIGHRDTTVTKTRRIPNKESGEQMVLPEEPPSAIFQDMHQPKNRRQAQAAIRRQQLAAADNKADV